MCLGLWGEFTGEIESGLTGEGEVDGAQEVSVSREDGDAVCGDFGGGEGFRGHELAEEVYGGHRT